MFPLKFIKEVAGQWIESGEVSEYIGKIGGNYPVIIKALNGDRSAVSLEKLATIKDGVREAWFPSERNWEMITEHGMAHLEKAADAILAACKWL